MFYAKIGLFDIRNRHISQVCYANIAKHLYLAYGAPLGGIIMVGVGNRQIGVHFAVETAPCR